LIAAIITMHQLEYLNHCKLIEVVVNLIYSALSKCMIEIFWVLVFTFEKIEIDEYHS